jgi:hypothetical protein
VVVLLLDQLARAAEVLRGDLLAHLGIRGRPLGDQQRRRRRVEALVVERAALRIGQRLVGPLHPLEDRRELPLELREVLAVAQVRVKEAAPLEVGLGDPLGRGVARDAEQLVVRQPVDAPIRVLDELGVAGRPVRGLGGELDVQAVESPAPARRPVGALLLPLDDAARDQRVEDLPGRRARGARDLQQRIHVEDPVDAGEQVRLLRCQGQVLVTRHRVGREDRNAVAVAEPLAEDVGLRQTADALDDDRGGRERQRDVGSRTPAEAWNRYSPIPREGREDDLLDEPPHLGVEHGPRDEAALDEDLAEPGAALLGDGLERPVQVRVA